jgi:adenine-specific DNA-methyltransferase
MPSLNFKGKALVQNFHLLVPYHELKMVKSKSLTPKVSLHDNLVVHGDNLKALKSLLPYYAGKVKCIYIDPPYNTGTENWIYNDNVSSPMIQEWLGKVVDREDLTRHDKWLCMMMPRLKLLREFLTDDGVIFVSIDDNEVHWLRGLLDEIFGEENCVEQFVWKKSYGGGAKEKFIVRLHEYCLMYARNKDQLPALWLPPDEDAEARYYKYRDAKFKDRGPYRIKPLEATKSMDRRENLVFPIKGPGGVKITPKRQW